ncbi:hypothetical protein E2C01_044816 [Portunus trituberculatus]|uniref:Uncharacterized protein n=1 Tax=Portunus trituberculatus TaxID=210409 RepID=A0A5B7FU25_PORTR|nr:hypothetical protein [Portunus trituberculatus]
MEPQELLETGMESTGTTGAAKVDMESAGTTVIEWKCSRLPQASNPRAARWYRWRSRSRQGGAGRAGQGAKGRRETSNVRGGVEKTLKASAERKDAEGVCCKMQKASAVRRRKRLQEDAESVGRV